ncbi:putative leader peptide [Streptosporangium fragile]
MIHPLRLTRRRHVDLCRVTDAMCPSVRL